MPDALDQEKRSPPQPQPFTQTFTSPALAGPRKAYLRVLISGCTFIVITIFAIFSIYWGALWKTPVRNLKGWVVDFDDALIGQFVSQALTATSSPQSELSKITWTSIPSSSLPNGLQQIANAVVEQKVWVVIAVNANATSRLQGSYMSPDAGYDGTKAITVYAAEARNENAYRSIIIPSVQTQLTAIAEQFALREAGALVANTSSAGRNVAEIIGASPQTVLTPIGHTLVNLVPFDQPIASAVTLIGLILQLILAFFVVLISNTARELTGLNRTLTLRSLIKVRYASAFTVYFVIALFYALVSVAFQLDLTRKFGHGGFVVFWMLNWLGMLSVGLALESLITLLTLRFLPFFLITWIIVNVSVSMFPIEVLPVVFRYGYVAPFYNISHGVRCIVFGTKNTVGVNFAVLIVWTAISCTTLPLIQWYVRRKAAAAAGAPAASAVSAATTPASVRSDSAIFDADRRSPGSNVALSKDSDTSRSSGV